MLPISLSGSSSATSGSNAGPIDTTQASAFNFSRGPGDASNSQSRGGGFSIDPKVALIGAVVLAAAVVMVVVLRRK